MVPRPTPSPSKIRRASVTYEFFDVLGTQWRRAGGPIDPRIVTLLRRRGYDPLNRLPPRERELMAADTSEAAAAIEARLRRIRQCGALTALGVFQTEGVHRGRAPGCEWATVNMTSRTTELSIAPAMALAAQLLGS